MVSFHDFYYTLRPLKFMSLDHVEPTDDILEPVPALRVDGLRHYGLGRSYFAALLLEMEDSEERRVSCDRQGGIF
jgi:hypothetical protein